eukprot:3373608-Rhodomonas_salina.3
MRRHIAADDMPVLEITWPEGTYLVLDALVPDDLLERVLDRRTIRLLVRAAVCVSTGHPVAAAYVTNGHPVAAGDVSTPPSSVSVA